MPRVSDEYLKQRRQQILDAARRCFARQGFYETTMQDVFAESGLSAGAVYRYFKTKDDLIQAISAGTPGPLGAVIEQALAEDPLPGLDEIAGRMAAAAQELSGPDGPGRVGPAAWAAALHDPRVAVVVSDVFGSLRAQWATVVRRMVRDERLAAETDVEAVASALFALMLGFLLQHLILADIDADAMRSGLRALLRPAALSTGTPDGPSLG